VAIGILDVIKSTERGVVTADLVGELFFLMENTGMSTNWLILNAISSKAPFIFYGSMLYLVGSLTKGGYFAKCEVSSKF
jgi:hypothetical protein